LLPRNLAAKHNPGQTIAALKAATIDSLHGHLRALRNYNPEITLTLRTSAGQISCHYLRPSRSLNPARMAWMFRSCWATCLSISRTRISVSSRHRNDVDQTHPVEIYVGRFNREVYTMRPSYRVVFFFSQRLFPKLTRISQCDVQVCTRFHREDTSSHERLSLKQFGKANTGAENPSRGFYQQSDSARLGARRIVL
jgi:hypothetical protein